MTTLRFSQDELMRSHDYAVPHLEGGRRLHGGFAADGSYIPPRFAVRGTAIEAWTEALRSRGGEPLAADASLLGGVRYPNEAQTKLMLKEHLGQSFWNTLTITGHIEARGRLLAEMSFPDFQDVIEDDISEMGIGHLNGGLLLAHGLDEGGEPDRGIGGHDVMWFVLRDLAFGEVNYPEPEVPENIARPEGELVLPPEIPEAHARFLSFLLNLLLIEFRAELGFSLTENVLRDPELFPGRRAEADLAAEIIGRIRRDEEIHVGSLRLFLGELRQVHFKGLGGARIPGHRVVDPIWQGIVHWATVDQPKFVAEQQKQMLSDRILAHPDGERILAAFHALVDAA